jgi:nitrous oxide reductase accessory protein NosL
MRRFALALLLTLWAALATAQLPPKPGPKDSCPVCGMLVSKYPNWVATIVYKDGHAHHFDGAKDLFKFWFDPPKYAARHNRDMVASIWVTDYYGLQKIVARKAYYVIGSDVLGPMGHEFVPLANKADAEDFMKEHQGARLLSFEQVGKDLPARLDDGKF